MMNIICVKLRKKNCPNKYRKMLSERKDIYDDTLKLVEKSYPYEVEGNLEKGEWFRIENFSQKEYALDIIKGGYDTVNYDLMNKNEFQEIDYLFVIK